MFFDYIWKTQRCLPSNIFFNPMKQTLIMNHLQNEYPEITNDELTPREITIVKLVAEGRSNNEISSSLFISKHTVKTHRKNINSKLKIHNSTELTMFAIQTGILTISEAITG